MSDDLERALKRHIQWFGSYKKSGELKKIPVWLILNRGQLEFLTPQDSYKVKRVRRNPRVICNVGTKQGPAIAGRAKIIGLLVWIGITRGSRVVVRVVPDEPNPLLNLSHPA